MTHKTGMSKKQGASMGKEIGMSKQHGGHLYMQTNEIQTAIVHYSRSATAEVPEVERVLTGGTGSRTFKPI